MITWTLTYTSSKYHYWKHITTGIYNVTTDNKPPLTDIGYKSILDLAILKNEPYETLKDIQKRIF